MASHSEVGRTQLASFDNYQLTIPKLESQQPPLAISIPQLPSLSTLRSPLTTTSGNRLYGASSICDIFASTKEHRRSQPRRISALYPPPAPRSILASHGSLNDRRQRRDYVRRSRDESDRRRLKEQIYKNPAFQDYRRNAGKPGTSSKDGPRWPDWMESDFWDAFLTIPYTGSRHRFKLYRPLNEADVRDYNKWRPAGHNQWIAEWLSLCFALRFPNASSEEKSKFDLFTERKKVSSHLQVVKGKIRGKDETIPPSPLFKALFPIIKHSTGDKGFQQYLDNHPVLVALREGRLPPRHRIRVPSSLDCTPMTFGMYVTRKDEFSVQTLHWYTPSTELNHHVETKQQKHEDLGYDTLDSGNGGGDEVTPRETGLVGTLKQRDRANIESVRNYRELFPEVENLRQSTQDIPEVIHIRSRLYLNKASFPANAEITTRFEISVPPGNNKWTCKTTTHKPASLHGPIDEDPQVVDKVMSLEELETPGSEKDDSRVRLRVPVSATFWAHAFSKLHEISQAHDHDLRWSEYPNTASENPTEQLISGITMYHEISSQDSSNGGKSRLKMRAILLFTFQQAESPEEAIQDWQYLDIFPEREEVLAPLPPPYQQEQAIRNETFSSIYRHDPLPILNSDSLSVNINYDPLSYGHTPPLTAGSTSTFDQYSFQGNDLDASNLSFLSEATQSNEAAQNGQDYPKLHTNSYRALDPISMSFDAASDGWQLPPPLTSIYDQPTNFYTPITTLPPLSNAQVWDNDAAFHQPDWSGQNGYIYASQNQHLQMQ